MRILLDTHIFLWFITDDQRLPAALRDAIRERSNEVYLSVVSVWEAIVKHQLGKLPLAEPPETYLPEQRKRHSISVLPIDEPSVSRLATLPSIHRDPFDRMLVAQALEHDLTIATVDESISAYPVTVFGQE